MSFVFSWWYIVAAILVVGIAVCLFFFFKMDKQDRVIINKFLEDSQKEEVEEPVNESTNNEEKPKVKKCKYCEASNDVDAKKCFSCGADLYIK